MFYEESFGTVCPQCGSSLHPSVCLSAKLLGSATSVLQYCLAAMSPHSESFRTVYLPCISTLNISLLSDCLFGILQYCLPCCFTQNLFVCLSCYRPGNLQLCLPCCPTRNPSVVCLVHLTESFRTICRPAELLHSVSLSTDYPVAPLGILHHCLPCCSTQNSLGLPYWCTSQVPWELSSKLLHSESFSTTCLVPHLESFRTVCLVPHPEFSKCRHIAPHISPPFSI